LGKHRDYCPAAFCPKILTLPAVSAYPIKNYLLLLMLLLGSSTYSFPTKTGRAPVSIRKGPAAPKVYICKGGSAYTYHKSDRCSGLNRCTHTIVAVSKGDAERAHRRRPCKKCD
jgi:hypothetical protein